MEKVGAGGINDGWGGDVGRYFRGGGGGGVDHTTEPEFSVSQNREVSQTCMFRAGVLSPTYFWEVTQTCMFMTEKNLLF